MRRAYTSIEHTGQKNATLHRAVFLSRQVPLPAACIILGLAAALLAEQNLGALGLELVVHT